ncbi:MAG: DUF6055 domain-containing protein, partial [bacterium]
MPTKTKRIAMLAALTVAAFVVGAGTAGAATHVYLDNQTEYSNQDPNNETRRSDHFRLNFGHYNRDTGAPVTEQFVQGNLQMFEQLWQRNMVELGLNDMGQSADLAKRDGNYYRVNFNILMTRDDGGGGGAYMSMDGSGFSYAMANSGYCRYDPPSGATPHEIGHAWEGQARGFNGSDSSGAWWECTANWFQLQLLNSYPQAGGYLYNSVFYPAHGRDYYDSWMIWEAAKEDPRYGTAWFNNVWTNATADQQVSEYIIDRMIRLDSSGAADKAGAVKDLWGDMAKKMVTWDYARQRWFAQANTPWNGDTWEWYTRCRAPLVKMPGTNGWYRPAREHMPIQFGFHFVPLSAAAGTTVSCNFQPLCDPVRQSDWRACLVAVNSAGEAGYSALWNIGTHSIALSADQSQLYLMVIAVPKPMKIGDPAWSEYTRDSGLQFPYTVSFVNASPLNVIYPAQSRTGMHQHANGGGWVANTATVDATAYVGPDAQVLNTAQVRNFARIEEYGVVRNNAQVRDNAAVSGHGMVYENAQVSGNAKVRDWAMVSGYTELYGNAKAIEHAGCGGGDSGSHNVVCGDVVLKGVTSVYSPSTFSGSLITDGDTANGGTGDHGVHFGWQWGQNPSVFPALTDNGYQVCGLTFERDNPVFACDQYGINHGYLMNGCRPAADTGGTPRGGYVLPLNGTNQYVELHNSLNDFEKLSVAVWAKWTGGANDQKIWSMGDGTNKVMCLTPSDAGTGKLRFVISDGTVTQSVEGASALGAAWAHVAVVFSNSTATLYLNGAQAGQVTNLTVTPEQLNAPLMENANYLGRGNAGHYFQGSFDDFRVYNKTLSAAEVAALYNTAAPSPVTPAADTAAPTPNAATWLAAPVALGDSIITMSATPGTDASGWVEYYFACVSGGGHDSGWVSFNKYTDCGLTPGTVYTYTVKLRDRNGNTTAASSPSGATTLVSGAGTASFAYGPVGIANGQITMAAAKQTNASGKAEYTFDRTGKSSGWQSSPTWTDTGLTTGGSYTYTVTVRDGRGNTSAPSAGAAALARDDAGPALPVLAEAHWQMLPYATIDNKVSMTAQEASDPAGAEYFFHCVSGGGADSAWQASATFVTPAALPDGTYVYQYKVRDMSARTNESAYSASYPATITPTTGYHPCSFAQLATLPDDHLVTFSGTITGVNPDSYRVKDTNSSATVIVKPNTYGQATDLTLAFKTVSVNGHLYTYTNYGGRLVSYASLAAVGNPPYGISGTVTNASGAGLAGITVYFSDTPNASTSPAGLAVTDSGGHYALPILDGTWYVAAGSSNYLTSADQTVVLSSANVTNINFVLVAKPRISGKVTDLAGAALSGATVWFSLAPEAPANAAFVAATDASGNYTRVVDSATYYVCAGASNYLISAEQVVAANGSVSNICFSLTQAGSRSVPQPDQLLFACVTDPLPLSGAIASWPAYLPVGQVLTAMGTPTAEVANGKKWESQVYADNAGFRQGTYAAPIACNGASIVTVVMPKRNGTGTSWTSVVDIFYDRLVLGVKNDTGNVCVRRNGSLDLTAAAIPDGQVTVLSLVVQPNGQYKVWANGLPIYTNTSTSALTSLVNGVAGGFANSVNVGRNDPDGWTTFNGNIGDVFVYTNALADADRQQLENDLITRSGTNATRTITASAGTGGSVVPNGTVTILSGTNQTFTLIPLAVYSVEDVRVDGVSHGPVSSYTFTNVVANHTISATFIPTTHAITATAGAHGAISPTGTVNVVEGTDQTFVFTPEPGYMVDAVLADGVSVGRAASYTFTNVMTGHTLAVTFKVLVAFTITASAGPNGTISPSGAVMALESNNQTFVIAPDRTYGIGAVLVDGVTVGKVSSYTFTNVVANHTIAASFEYVGRDVPRTDQLIFSVVTDTFPTNGSTGAWATFMPAGQTLAMIGSPTVEMIDGVKWEKNIYTDQDGYMQARYAAPITCSGITIMAAVRPTYTNVGGEARGEIVDIFYDRLALAVSHTDGRIMVARNYWNDWGPAIPNGQRTILSLVVQTDGSYQVYTNGALAMSGGANGDWTSIDPNHTATWGDDPDYTHYVNVGRNQPDGWSTFNGNIGDVFLYKVALSTAERQQLEADLAAKFLPLPAVPTGLAATSTSSLVNLRWTAAAKATGYKVKRSLVSGGPYFVIGTVAVTNYADSAVTNGTAYHYVVSATNNVGESANSAQASATPAGAASATTLGSSLGAAGTYGQAVTFTATVTVTGGPATGIVTFKDGGTVLGTGALNGAGQATLTSSAVSAGNRSITAVYGGDIQFMPSTSSAFAYTVTPKPVTVTGVTAAGKAYDGTPAATLSGGTVTGVINGDTVTVVLGTGTFESASVGTWPVTATGCSLGGAQAGNYALSAQPDPGSASIAARAVTITGVTAAGKTYDGTAVATLSGGTVAGVVGGEAVTAVPGSGTFASASVGTWTVTATGYTLGGTHKGNYMLAAQPAPGSAAITARPVQLTGSRVYDGTVVASASILSVTNNVDGTNLTLTGNAILAGKDVGPQALADTTSLACVQRATGNTGTGTAVAVAVTLGTAPANGNTLVAVISTRGTSSGRVSSISQAGASWTRAAEAANANGTTAEI